MMSWKPALLGMGVLALAAACGEKPAPPAPAAEIAGPALWKVGDADTTVYLFGTVHVLPSELVWRTPQIDKALGEAKAVYFETDINPDPNMMNPIVQTLGMYPPSETLSDNLKPDDRTALAAAAEKLQLPMVILNKMKPWLAAVTISEQMVNGAGYDTNSGVERKLLPSAEGAGKEIRKLETVEEQLMVFADLSEEVQIAFLMDGVRHMEDESEILDDMVNAWATGDIDTLNKIMIDQDLAESPDVYQALLVKRNEHWVTEIDDLIKTQSGTYFVAVGAAHLVGKDSVIAKLTPLGYAAERLESKRPGPAPPQDPTKG